MEKKTVSEFLQVSIQTLHGWAGFGILGKNGSPGRGRTRIYDEGVLSRAMIARQLFGAGFPGRQVVSVLDTLETSVASAPGRYLIVGADGSATVSVRREDDAPMIDAAVKPVTLVDLVDVEHQVGEFLFDV